jgi:hypothetical protein
VSKFIIFNMLVQTFLTPSFGHQKAFAAPAALYKNMTDYTTPDELSYGIELPFENLEYDEMEHSIVIPFAASLRRDRIGDYLDVNGIETANHQKNPVCFLDHGRHLALPIGKCQDAQGNYTVWIEDDMAWAKIYLAVGMPYPAGSPTPELVFELYKGGFLKAGSIGYRPLVAERINPEPEVGYYKSALWLKKVELQEVTICGLPMNQDTVKSSLASGVLNGKPLTNSIKSLLTKTLPKVYSQGIDISMNKMSAVDQSQGGSFVAPAGSQTQKRKKGVTQDNLGWWFTDASGACYGPYDTEDVAEDVQQNRENKNKMNKAEDKPDVKPEPVELAKADDSPDLPVTLQACKEHLEAAAEHADTPDELRASHSHFAKQIGDALAKSEDGGDEDDGEEDDGEKSMKSDDGEDEDTKDDEDEDTKDEDNAPHEEQDDLDLIHDVKEHLEDSADHEDCTPIMKAAHLYHADQLDKCMGKSEEEEISEQDGNKILSFLQRIGKRLGDAERKIFKTFGR